MAIREEFQRLFMMSEPEALSLNAQAALGAVHVPQLSRPPHPSPAGPQVIPCSEHVLGVHRPPSPRPFLPPCALKALSALAGWSALSAEQPTVPVTWRAVSNPKNPAKSVTRFMMVLLLRRVDRRGRRAGCQRECA